MLYERVYSVLVSIIKNQSYTKSVLVVHGAKIASAHVGPHHRNGQGHTIFWYGAISMVINL